MANAISSLNYNSNTYPFTLPYGVCSTAAATAAKEVTVPNFSLEAGAVVIVKFTYANSASSPTLNVNSTGAKPMYRYGTTAMSTSASTTGWSAGAVQMFTYDGTGWVRDFWTNSTYSNVSLGQGYCTCSTAAATTAKTASLSSYSLSTGGIVAVKFTYAVPASATLNINSKGAKSIYHEGAAIKAGVIEAGDIATFIYSSQYHLISINKAGVGGTGISVDGYTINHSNSVTAGTASGSSGTLSHGGTFTIPSITYDAQGHITSKTTTTCTLPAQYTHPSYTARTGVPTANATLTFGGTFNVSQPTSDATGHVTALNTRTYTMPSDRLFETLVPSGTVIPANADLDTQTYLKVGRYYCSSNANVKTLLNCPVTVYDSSGAGTSGTAFMMNVYSPLSTTIDNEATGTWVYRTRVLTTYTGDQYIQSCYSNGTAGNWSYGTWKKVISAAEDTAIGSATQPIYLNSSGNLTVCTYTLGKSVPSNAVFTDTNTHYTTRIYAGASGTAANAAATSPYIKITDDNTYRNQIRLVGSGATTVTSDANGNITISSTDNNTTYSAATTSANGLMTAAMVTKLNGIAAGANAYSLPAATSSALGGVKVGSNITVSSGTISLTKANVTAALGYTPPTSDTNTTYSAGTGISLSGTTFSNSGVRSIATGSSNGTISVNTNGTSANVAVKGLGSAAYTASTAYAAASHNHYSLYNDTASVTLGWVYDSSDSQMYLRAGTSSSIDTSSVCNLGASSAPWNKVFAKQISNPNGSLTLANSENSIVYAMSSGTGYFRPSNNADDALGGSSYRWSTLFSKNAVNTSSDYYQKENIQNMPQKYIDMLDDIEPVIFKFKTGDRMHGGYISQWVEESMNKFGITAEEFGGFCKDPKLDEDENVVEGEYEYSLRYSEFVPVLHAKVKQLESRHNEELKELNNKIAELEARLNIG